MGDAISIGLYETGENLRDHFARLWYGRRSVCVCVCVCVGMYMCLHDTTAPSGPWPAYCRGFTITLRHITLGRNPLGEWSAPRGELYLTSHSTHNRQTSIPPAGFELVIPANELPCGPCGRRGLEYLNNSVGGDADLPGVC
jgi:hypothetical protein